MKKTAADSSILYEIEWSIPFRYDRISAGRILPDMPGILFFTEKKGDSHYPLLIFAAWREGVRSGMKNLMDEMFSAMPETSKQLKQKELYYRYAVVDTTPQDMKDILFWLIRTYDPEFNTGTGFHDSGRFRDIGVKEKPMKR